MAVTLHDVARTAGVSIKTVSNVINGYPYIRADTRQRVEDAIAQLGYQPNLMARGLRSGRTGTISLVIPDLRNAYFAELADSVMRAASTHDLSVLIELSGRSRERELAALRSPRMRMVDGILFSPLALGQPDAGLLDIPTPMVLLGEQIFGGPTDHVTMQNVEAAAAATEHLLSLGRRRLLAFGAHKSESGGSSGLRLLGYRRALEAAGQPFRQELVIEVWDWHRSDGAEAMRAVLASGLAFDGVVAFNDSIALGAMRVLQEAGFRVPEDVAMIGFDDIDEARYSLPTLSTIDPGREEIAETAVRVLLERITGSRTAALPRQYVTSFRVIQRESSAVSKAQHATGPRAHNS